MNININSSEIRLTVNDDQDRVIKFNPCDIGFAERFYSLIAEFEDKDKEYNERAEAIGADNASDVYGIPKNTGEHLALLREICTYMKDRIDYVFGKGTSKAAFGDANTTNMFEQFFDSIKPYVQNARTSKVSKYTAAVDKNVMK